MNKVINFLCNTPLYIGLGVLYVALGVKAISNKLFDFSFYLHMKAGTDIGRKISTLTQQAKEFAAALKSQQDAQSSEGGKLARIFKPDVSNGVFQLGKKPTDN